MQRAGGAATRAAATDAAANGRAKPRRPPPRPGALQGSCGIYVPNRRAPRALAFAASTSRFLGAAVDSSAASSSPEILATSSTAERNAASLAFDGLLKPVIFLTNCSDAA